MPAKPSTSARLFLALWPEPQTLRELLAWRERWSWPAGARITPPERLHLTLHFIGPVAQARLPGLGPALRVAVPAFEIEFDQVQSWPRGLMALCPQVLPPGLVALHQALQNMLQAVPLPVEQRRFRPHVTLARDASGALPPEGEFCLRWPVRGYALVQSENGYRTLLHYT